MLLLAMASSGSLVENSGFEAGDKAPVGYELTGGAKWFVTGYDDEIASPGVAFNSFEAKEGAVSQLVSGIDQTRGKWIRFTFRGMAEDGFKVPEKGLWMKMDFFAGTSSRDSAQRLITHEIEVDRKDFTSNGDFGMNGAEVWRSYEFEELLPFPEVDSVRLTIGYKDGSGKAVQGSYFFIDDFILEQSDRSATGRVEPNAKPLDAPTSTDGMAALGGRWFYKPAPGENVGSTTIVTSANADRLFYKSDRLTNPFAGNMSSWLRKGFKDAAGKIVTQDRFVEDSVTLTFDGSGFVRVFTRNLPNHPTAKFPDTYGTQGYNPSYIQEQNSTYRLPLEPKPQAGAAFLSATNNQALPMGPVGVAVNGVVFFNPYDAGMMDATSLMDRCCGHPNPGQNQYHYHKYPICVNTPFVDKGEAHSPIIGFAFDGYPVYGPYESKGVMAKDLGTNKLNAYNMHSDEIRGMHYHVTPGRFPYILGGYYGTPASGNTFRPRPPQGG
jgi:hypothetical protein